MLFLANFLAKKTGVYNLDDPLDGCPVISLESHLWILMPHDLHGFPQRYPMILGHLIEPVAQPQIKNRSLKIMRNLHGFHISPRS